MAVDFIKPNKFFLSSLQNLSLRRLNHTISRVRTSTWRSQKQDLRLPTFEDSFLLYQFSSPTEEPGFSNRIPEEFDGEPLELVLPRVEQKGLPISSNMWWADLKAAVGQRINVEGIVSSVSVVVRDRRLVLPHISVKDLRYIDWGELKRNGFKGVVFDKDNTLTAPYSLAIWPPLRPSIERCKAMFGHDIAVFSNSAGNIWISFEFLFLFDCTLQQIWSFDSTRLTPLKVIDSVLSNAVFATAIIGRTRIIAFF